MPDPDPPAAPPPNAMEMTHSEWKAAKLKLLTEETVRARAARDAAAMASLARRYAPKEITR